MASDKRSHLSQPQRMSLEAYRGTGRRTTGKACILGLTLVQGQPLELSMGRKGEEERQGGAEEFVKN